MGVLWVFEPFGQFSYHPRIDFNSYDFFGSLEKKLCEVSCSWSNLKYNICGSNSGFVDHFLKNMWIDEYVLSIRFIEDHACSIDCLFFFDHVFVDCWIDR